MRRFRAIIETHIEPEDHEVLWYWKGKLHYWGNDAWEPFLLVETDEIPYETEEDKSVSTVKEALDKLMYVIPEVALTLKEAGVYERGSTINQLNFSWNYNKEIKNQSLNYIVMPPSIREARLNIKVSTDTTFTLNGDDGTTECIDSASIRFVDYLYYGKSHEDPQKLKINPSNAELTVTTDENEHIWIFIPDTSGLTKIWHDNIESTDAFTHYPMVFHTDTGLDVRGVSYVSKHSGLGTVTLKIT